MLWFVWLRGFKIVIADDVLYYRDGLYHTVTLDLRDVKNVRNSWIQWARLGRQVSVPRLVITYGTPPKQLALNIKPFRREDLQVLRQTLKKEIE
jgi:hypothetical protein